MEENLSRLESLTDSAAGLAFGPDPVSDISSPEQDFKPEDAGTEDPIAAPLDWTGPDDPDDPHNWSLSRKLFLLNSVGLLCLTVTFATSVITGGIPEIMSQYQISQVTAFLTVTIFTIGLSVGPTVGAPVSELFGRRVVYLVTLPIAMLFSVGAALSPSFAGHLICRFLASFAGSPVLAVSAGTIADIFTPRSQGLALAFFCATGPFMGPVLGPVAGGWIATRKNWKWTMWLYLMLSGAVLVPLVFAKESYKPVILKRRAKAQGLKLPPRPPISASLKMVATITLSRPLKMLATDPVVSSLSLYAAFVFAVLLGFFEAIPFVFRTVYHFSIGQAGLVFLSIGTGILLSVLIAYGVERFYYIPALESRKTLPAEYRLMCAYIGSVFLPVSLFWFGWTARESIHWIVPALAGIPFGAALSLLFFSIVTYLVDCYGQALGASALAANNLARYLVAAPFPLFTTIMYRNLGIGWASSLLGFIAIGLMPLPFLMRVYGPALRKRRT